MIEANHTPGKWIYGDWVRGKKGRVDDGGWVEVWVDDKIKGKSLPIIACKHHDELANARLISAAPDLLEVVQRLVDDGLSVTTMKKARAALKKAAGAE